MTQYFTQALRPPQWSADTASTTTNIDPLAMEAEMLIAMHEFSSWLPLHIRMLMKYTNLLDVDEREVHASKTTMTAFNNIENAGDNYLCEQCPAWVKNTLKRMHCNSGHPATRVWPGSWPRTMRPARH